MSLRRLGRSKAKASLARANSIEVNITGDYEDDRQKFQSMSQHLGVNYSGNSVVDSDIDNRVDTLETEMNTAEGRLDILEARDVSMFNGDDIVVSDVVVANTITETTLLESNIPANTITTPTMFELYTSGIYSTANSSDSFTVRIKMNDVTVYSFVSVAKNVTNTPVQLSSTATIRTTGVSGTFVSNATFLVLNDSLLGASTATGSINTTIVNNIKVTMQWGSAKAGNTGTIYQGILKFHANKG